MDLPRQMLHLKYNASIPLSKAFLLLFLKLYLVVFVC